MLRRSCVAQCSVSEAAVRLSIATGQIPEKRLRLNFACCYPALEPKLRVALTQRSFCGLTLPETARAFLDAEPTMGQRLNRAKGPIASAGIPFAMLAPDLWSTRLAAQSPVGQWFRPLVKTAADQTPKRSIKSKLFAIHCPP